MTPHIRSGRPSEPRLLPLSHDEQSDLARELMAKATAPGGPVDNVLHTLMHHPRLFRRWGPAAAFFLRGDVPARIRELAILRTGWLCGAEYEWGHHMIIGREAGLTDEEIEAVKDPTGREWDAFDTAVLTAVDELHDDACLTDATWASLSASLPASQLVELIMLIGHYHQVCFLLNSLGIRREDGIPGFKA